MPQSFAEEFRSIPMSTHLGQSLERAHRFAREQSHRAVTLEHLLLALTEDAEAALILQSANIELGRLSTEVSGYLGRLPEDMRSDGTTEPRPDAELLRVLQAAASAAKQSRRRQIDGAIVLAAVVGDGKTPAAGLLKALGMTFEEAIRALQRANTKARLKPVAKPATTEAAAAQAPATSPAAPLRADAEPVAAEVSASPQSAEDILAAARARIQRRSGAGAGRSEPASAGEASAASTPGMPGSAVDASAGEPLEATPTRSLTEAIEAAMSGTIVRAVEAAPQSAPPPAAVPVQAAPSVARPSPPAWTPPPEPRPQPATRPPPPARPRPPFPGRPIAPGEGPRRPPLPAPSAVTGQPPQGFPNRPAPAPWPELGERGSVRPSVANGSFARPPPAPALAERPVGRVPQPTTQRAGGAAEKGLLLETVPRRMRMGVPAIAEVRIARDRIDGLIVALNGSGSVSLAEQSLMRAVSVRLRAPGGEFWIEPAAPETQWVEGAPSLIHDDYASWRWTVVARRRGRGKLALMVSARTIGRDGVAAESAPPDRVIEVKVGGNYRQAARRWAGWVVALLVGALIGRFSDQIWVVAASAISAVMKKALGG